MEYPKLVIASDGEYTGVLLDGVFIGCGVEKLVFSAEERNGRMMSTIRIMDLDVEMARLEKDTEKFAKFVEAIAKKDLAAPAVTDEGK